ncbi:MAG TPA: hypothetical protein VFO19_08460 [Vicinamibacterales bacterium]|nr:hypothetical protein [Vicinamibacterales bacterium]
MPSGTSPAYPAAHLIVDRVKQRFAKHLENARAAGHAPLAPPPDDEAIQSIVDAAFWASLRREEGVEPKISLALVPPEQAGQPLRFQKRLPLLPAALARLAPAVERASIHLGVWREAGEPFYVWGTARSLPEVCFVIEVVASGLLVIKQSGEPFGKFVNVAVLEGDQIKMVDERNAFMPECPDVVQSLLGLDIDGLRGEAQNVLVQIAASMRRHGRGGALLVVPAGSTTWRDSIVSPVLYALDPPFTELSRLIREEHDATHQPEWQDALRNTIDAIGGLTAVDGATIISDAFEVLAFGAKITPRRGNAGVDRVLASEPIEGSQSTFATPTQLGGTRHLSAAQFVHDQRDAIALVASQDGRFTIFRWSKANDAVHAHRVEALLL